MELTKDNILSELNRWFSKSILMNDSITFNEKVLSDSLAIFLTDYNRYFPESKSIELENVLLRAELQGILLYRLARNYFLLGDLKSADKLALLGRFLSGFEIYYSADIGHSLKINHGFGLVVGARVVLGNNVLLHHGVTFGDKAGGRPVVGNNVVVYAGAKIIGNIKVGNNVVIAANSVCFINIPDNKTVVGIPAKIINK